MTQRGARRQLDLLRRAREFRLLFLSAVGSGLGTRLAVLALIVDIWDRTHSGKWVAALLVGDFVPMIVIGLLLGSFVDRFSRRRLMIGSDLLRCAVFCLLPFATSSWMVVGLASVAGFATGFFRPAVYAGLPNLVSDAELPEANGLFQAAENLTWMLGPLLGGVLLSFSTPDLAYWVNAVTFLFSALLIVRIPERLLQSEKALSEGHWRDLAEGYRLAARSRALMTVLVGWSLVTFALGNSDVSEVELVRVAFDAGNFGLGLLMAASGLGLIFGSLAAGWVAERWGTAAAYGGSIAAMAVGLGAAAVASTVWVAAVFVVAMGVGNGIAVVANSLLVQRGTPDHLRGRAFTLAMSVTYSALFIGMLIGGVLSDALGARMAWGVAAAVAGVAAVASYLLARGIPGAVPEHIESLEPLPIVAGAGGDPAELGALRE
ncbi:MAG TPA: MFS transporter [Gaiellaceae bacterium]|nr:MFS transporter [Gaiellaceae bacterium]